MPRIHQCHGQTDGRTTYDSNTVLALHASRGKNVSARCIQVFCIAHNVRNSCQQLTLKVKKTLLKYVYYL